ncbi:MAG TPA: hypothetical protein VF605_00585 [Allosphingosinicella sp.]|jgi:hypothetical protein
MSGFLLGLLLLADPAAAEPPPAELPENIGPEATRLFETYIVCLAHETRERRADRRTTLDLAAEARGGCAGPKRDAADALVAAYRRDPTLLGGGETAATKAAKLMATWDVRIEWVVDQARAKTGER